ncbi:uncharacterized protein LOC142295821 [Anomaloglossus baeobatrachus]|uniref:uncharacterized protein LOC142295821 n=1 Tax=Anomaloglossus baeobatrachus TaxID=238106 RepID=UPI003F506405
MEQLEYQVTHLTVPTGGPEEEANCRQPVLMADAVDLVKRRWRSARDQYRREYNPIPSSSSQGRKRRYVYYEQISFLAPILEVTQTEDNLDDSDEQPTAGPSATATSASEQEPGREDSENQEIQQDAAAATDSHEGGTESAQTNTQGSSTQQTTTPATQSTQTNVLPRFAPQPLRARRIRRPEEMRSLPEIIDTRIIHIMNTLIPETDAERFCRSLSTSLTKIPSDRQERVRAAMLTLLSASQAEQEPVRVTQRVLFQKQKPHHLECFCGTGKPIINRKRSNYSSQTLITLTQKLEENTKILILFRKLPGYTTDISKLNIPIDTPYLINS